MTGVAGSRGGSSGPAPAPELAEALEALGPGLDLCVHCGFCLPACPTYVRLGDEADSPRGRLHLMRAVVDGRLDVGSDAFRTHIDRCLGCRACEPVCPSSVPYGSLLEHARRAVAAHRPPHRATGVLLGVFGSSRRRGPVLALARLLRRPGWAGAVARRLPRRGIPGMLRRALSMLQGSAPWRPDRLASPPEHEGVDGMVAAGPAPDDPTGPPPTPDAVDTAILEGCVQAGLFARVNEATAAVLSLNGYAVRPALGQECCGALHAHAGELDEARRLARLNIAAFEAAGVERVAVNAAGCGAALREYGAWLAHDPVWRDRGRALSARVADVTELLADRGPRPGAPLVGTVAYDPPCHLEHAQGVTSAPERVLRAIPGLDVRRAEGASECCGGAGLYGLTHPELGGRIGTDKVRALIRTGASCIATGNPGCMMQIASFLRDEEADLDVAHPVELLLESYRRAGLLDGG